MGSAVIRAKVNMQGLRKKTTAMMEDSATVVRIAELAKTLMEPYVPCESGFLRASAEVQSYSSNGRVRIDYSAVGGESSSAAQGLDGIVQHSNDSYAHYIYEGRVYGPVKQTKPNNPKHPESVGGAYYSIPGKNKQPTGKSMTYHHPSGITTDHWDKVIQRGGDKYEDFTKGAKEILKEEAKKNDG